jgi:hypothetical protein
MPGFMINGQGTGPSNIKEFLWQHRWLVDRMGKYIDKNEAFVAKEIALPDMKIDRQEILGGFIYYKFAKSVRWDDAVVTFYDDSKISANIDAWREDVYTEDKGILQHSGNNGYKQDSIFLLLDGQGETVKKFILKNSWPVNISQGRLTYTESDFKFVVVTLSFDWAELVVIKENLEGGAEGGFGGGGGVGGASPGSFGAGLGGAETA